jgi:uncharacterized protein (UPF0332 family)
MPDPEHLFQQAERLMIPLPPETEPRQTDLRRAISAAYYGLFHFAVRGSVDLFIGTEKRSTKEYTTPYRRRGMHEALRILCGQLQKEQMTAFGEVRKFASTVAELQDLRLKADYDPSYSITADQVRIRLDEARRAVALFQEATEIQRTALLALLFFDFRRGR